MWTDEERATVPRQYNCEILFHNAKNEDLMNPDLPSDAYIVSYNGEDGVINDLCRSSKQSNIFDLYYDKIGNNIRKIDYGYGRLNPRLWGLPVADKASKQQ